MLDVVTARPEVTRWPHCRRCRKPLEAVVGFTHSANDRRLCDDCRDDAFERACSYGGSAGEISVRYSRFIEKGTPHGDS